MEDPFFHPFWMPAQAARPPTTTAKPPRRSKVVSVPVLFVGSDETPHRQPATAVAGDDGGRKPTVSITKLAAAVRIQSTFRGFLVRKNVRAVRRLEAEIDAIEKEMKEEGERLRCEAKERLRVNEMLMSVLLRLDSVRGVRSPRRRAVRRAIALQEAVDATAAAGTEAEDVTSPAGDDGGETSDEDTRRGTVQAQASVEILRATEGVGPTLEGGNLSSSADGGEEDAEGSFEGNDTAREGELTVTDAVEETAEVALSASSPLEFRDEGTGLKQTIDEAAEDAKRVKSAAEDAIEASTAQDEGSAEAKTLVESSVTGGAVLPSPAPSSLSHGVAEREGGLGCGEDMRRAMEKMVAQSRELKGLVAELCQRNDMQCRLLSGLLQRVDHLEKVVDRMGRKKKRQAADSRRGCTRKCDGKL